MEIIIEADYAALCARAAEVVRAELTRKPDLVLGLATGRTPLGLYERLKNDRAAFLKVRFFNLDELFGRGPSQADSFHSILRTNLIDHVSHDPANVHLLRGDVKDLEALSDEYEEKIRKAGGIDLQILGIGRNGHIGFNEPGSSLGSRTRPKELELQTLEDYVESLDAQLPLTRFAVTMGIGTILEARRLLMLASGLGKADIIKKMVEGPISAEVPASMVQFHRHAVVVLDEDAASKLKRRDYYKWVFANKWRVGQK